MNVRVLIVEDVKIAQKVAALTLRQLKCEVHTADNGLQALEMIKKNVYTLIFMDLGLPDIDGLTLTETIRKHTSYQPWVMEVPIIALTAHSDDVQLKQDCYRSGINDVLVKPLTIEFARRILEKWAPR